MPCLPLVEKTNVLVLAWKKGACSSPAVLIMDPAFTGLPVVPSVLMGAYQISKPPEPPGRSEAKYKYFPSAVMKGCLLLNPPAFTFGSRTGDDQPPVGCLVVT